MPGSDWSEVASMFGSDWSEVVGGHSQLFGGGSEQRGLISSAAVTGGAHAPESCCNGLVRAHDDDRLSL